MHLRLEGSAQCLRAPAHHVEIPEQARIVGACGGAGPNIWGVFLVREYAGQQGVVEAGLPLQQQPALIQGIIAHTEQHGRRPLFTQTSTGSPYRTTPGQRTYSLRFQLGQAF